MTGFAGKGDFTFGSWLKIGFHPTSGRYRPDDFEQLA
jgi:hypothetical protein